MNTEAKATRSPALQLRVLRGGLTRSRGSQQAQHFLSSGAISRASRIIRLPLVCPALLALQLRNLELLKPRGAHTLREGPQRPQPALQSYGGPCTRIQKS